MDKFDPTRLRGVHGFEATWDKHSLELASRAWNPRHGSIRQVDMGLVRSSGMAYPSIVERDDDIAQGNRAVGAANSGSEARGGGS